MRILLLVVAFALQNAVAADFGDGWTFTLVDADGVRHAPKDASCGLAASITKEL